MPSKSTKLGTDKCKIIICVLLSYNFFSKATPVGMTVHIAPE